MILETLLNEKNWETDLRKILNSNEDVFCEKYYNRILNNNCELVGIKFDFTENNVIS